MNIYVLSYLFFAFTGFLLALLVLLKRGDELARRWFYFNIIVVVWGLTYAFVCDNSIGQETALWIARFSQANCAFISPTWFYFVMSFLSIKPRRIYLLPWAIAFFLVAMSPTNLYVASVGPVKGFVHFTRPGPLMILQFVNFASLVLYAFYLMIRSYFFEHRTEKRKEILGLFFATSLGFLGGSSQFSLFFFGDKGIDITWLIMTYPFIMTYVMIKHHVFDIEKLADAFQREKLAAIGTMTASINHEIRNPLYVIKGMAESYLENLTQGLYPTQEEALQRSREILSKSIEQTQRAMEIIKRFALFAKQGTREEAQFEEVDLNRTFEEILPLVNHELELDKIQLIKEIPENLPPIHADRRHIEEIFFNLIVNACQAMKDGGKLAVRAEQRNGKVQVEIEDRGPGIPSDQLSKIFEPFYTTKESGTGLGLYVTKQLVERNNGHIFVESRLNKGTCFILGFPCKS